MLGGRGRRKLLPCFLLGEPAAEAAAEHSWAENARVSSGTASLLARGTSCTGYGVSHTVEGGLAVLEMDRPYHKPEDGSVYDERKPLRRDRLLGVGHESAIEIAVL